MSEQRNNIRPFSYHHVFRQHVKSLFKICMIMSLAEISFRRKIVNSNPVSTCFIRLQTTTHRTWYRVCAAWYNNHQELKRQVLVINIGKWQSCQETRFNSCKKIMTTSSKENIFRVTGLLCGEFIGPGEFPEQRPVTRSFDVFFCLSKQSWGGLFETPSRSLWCRCNVNHHCLQH